jgi:hypothetical protein
MMTSKRETRSSVWFVLSLLVAVYVILSASLAVATSDACDGGLDGPKTWQPFPPHWECSSR